jgi:hypothetical protein
MICSNRKINSKTLVWIVFWSELFSQCLFLFCCCNFFSCLSCLRNVWNGLDLLFSKIEKQFWLLFFFIFHYFLFGINKVFAFFLRLDMISGVQVILNQLRCWLLVNNFFFFFYFSFHLFFDDLWWNSDVFFFFFQVFLLFMMCMMASDDGEGSPTCSLMFILSSNVCGGCTWLMKVKIDASYHEIHSTDRPESFAANWKHSPLSLDTTPYS